MTDKPMSALAFLRAYARQATRGQLAALSAVAALDVFVQVSAVLSVHGTARVCWAIAMAVTWPLTWWFLGWSPAQRWIWGGRP
jgi:hypothetical protein